MPEPIEDQYIKVGYVARSQGVEGQVLILSDFANDDLFEAGRLVRLRNNRGDLIPARIETVSVKKSQRRLSFFIKFDHVADRSEAESLKGFGVYLPREEMPEPVEEEASMPDFSGFSIVDTENNIEGTVTEIIDSPAHPILQVEDRTGRELLIPLVDEYVAAIDEQEKVVRCRNLNQLLV